METRITRKNGNAAGHEPRKFVVLQPSSSAHPSRGLAVDQQAVPFSCLLVEFGKVPRGLPVCRLCEVGNNAY